MRGRDERESEERRGEREGGVVNGSITGCVNVLGLV